MIAGAWHPTGMPIDLMASFEAELQGERASALGEAGRRLEATLLALNELAADARPDRVEECLDEVGRGDGQMEPLGALAQPLGVAVGPEGDDSPVRVPMRLEPFEAGTAVVQRVSPRVQGKLVRRHD